jgi:hypothetical protein
MGFQDNFPRVHQSVFNAVGVPGDYLPSVGDPVLGIKVQIDHDVELSPEGQDFGVTTGGTTIETLLSDTGPPKRGDEFLVEGITYTVKGTAENDKTFVKVVVNEN